MNSKFIRIPEVARLLGIGRSAAYAAAKRGEIPTIKIGHLKLVPKSALQKMLMETDEKEDVVDVPRSLPASLIRGTGDSTNK